MGSQRVGHTLFFKRVSKVSQTFSKNDLLEMVFFFYTLFICFWLCCIFVALQWLSLVAASRGYYSLWCDNFSLWWLFLLCSIGFRRGGLVYALSFSLACGIFPDQGSNSSLLFWQVGSYPPCHQGSLMIDS